MFRTRDLRLVGPALGLYALLLMLGAPATVAAQDAAAATDAAAAPATDVPTIPLAPARAAHDSGRLRSIYAALR